MLLPITISLLISATSGATEQLELPPWPAGLPDATVSGAGTLLPPELASAVHYRLEACETLPRRCEARLLSADDVCSARLRAARVEAVARPGVPWQAWLGGGVVGALAGGAVTLWLTR